jgi:hypothetical protein
LHNFQLGAHNRETRLHQPIAPRALILLLIGARQVVVRRKSVALERVGVLFHNGNVGFESREAIVTKLVGAREVRMCNGVGTLQIWVKRCDKRAVGVVGEVEGAGANLRRCDERGCVVDDWVGLEMLVVVLVAFV